ncbi:hypothetical protein [Leucothrix pacifica]|uniref:Uncharacterized protein n=1 Tax=Leucothrix pacifica TaxID=1247513 RepID=A0A317C8R0_9GAMM|nr:hypothetical protein [Leucothrix pacifica]PWQ92522.1 hypothetical protein DKW60_20710 [Leucothrix pacifica]
MEQTGQWVDEESENAEVYQRLLATASRYKENKAGLLPDIELEHAKYWQDKLTANSSADIWAKRYDGAPSKQDNFEQVTDFIQLSDIAHHTAIEQEKAEQARQAKLLKEKAELDIANTKTEQASEEATLANIATEKALETSQKNEKAAKAAETLAQHRAQMAEQATKIARANELESNYNLAKAFEEKSLFSITRGNSLIKNTDDPHHPDAISEYRNALLYALEAQQRPLAQSKVAIKPETLGHLSRLPSNILSSSALTTPHLKLGSIQAIAYSPDGKVIAASDGNDIRLWRPDNLPPLYRFVYEFDPVEVPGAPRFFWELELEDLNFKHTPLPPSLFAQEGYHIT